MKCNLHDTLLVRRGHLDQSLTGVKQSQWVCPDCQKDQSAFFNSLTQPRGELEAKPQPEPFKREHRYLVVKTEDLVQYLNSQQLTAVFDAVRAVARGRAAEGKRDNRYVCVADDWPEYEAVWGMIEKRVSGGN